MVRVDGALTSKSFAKVPTFSHDVGRLGNGWEGIFYGSSQFLRNHLGWLGNRIPFFILRVASLAQNGLQETGCFADFEEETGADSGWMKAYRMVVDST